MSAKERLRRRVAAMSEPEAQEALEAAPADDEPPLPGEAEATAEARADVARGETFRHAELRRELLT